MVPDKERAEYVRYCAAARPGEPDEVADVVEFLASEGELHQRPERLRRRRNLMKWRVVDRIAPCEPWTAIEGHKCVSLEEYFLMERLGRRGALPESLLLAGFVELGRWLVCVSSGWPDAERAAGRGRGPRLCLSGRHGDTARSHGLACGAPGRRDHAGGARRGRGREGSHGPADAVALSARRADGAGSGAPHVGELVADSRGTLPIPWSHRLASLNSPDGAVVGDSEGMPS